MGHAYARLKGCLSLKWRDGLNKCTRRGENQRNFNENQRKFSEIEVKFRKNEEKLSKNYRNFEKVGVIT
mgnify:CR=1 FL=1